MATHRSPPLPQVPNSVKQVLSNGRCVQTRTLDAAEPTLRTWACDATPGMSTYLLALAAGSIDEVPPLVWSKGQLPATGNDTVDTWADDLQARLGLVGAPRCLLMPGGCCTVWRALCQPEYRASALPSWREQRPRPCACCL